MIHSHLCTGCGQELRHVPAPPDLVYALPVCTCPACGTSTIRRAHRFRTKPHAFMRLDKAFNRMALALFAILVLSGSAAGLALVAAAGEQDGDRSAIPAIIHSVHQASDAERFSIVLLLSIIAGLQILSGLVINRLLWFWRVGGLAVAWVVLLSLWCGLILLIRWWMNPGVSSIADTIEPLGSMSQVVGICWIIFALGVLVGRATMTKRDVVERRRFRRALRGARKQIRRRREG